MLARLRPRLTFANVVSVMALFVALGGSATAAVLITGKQVKNGSLTGTDLKNNSVGSVDVKDGDLLAKDFKAGQLVAGAPGPQGPQGPKGEAGAAGAKGNTGAAGSDFTIATTLASGQTERGIYDVWGSGASGYMGTAVNYRVPLAARLDSAHVIFNANGTTSAHCAGAWQAGAGYLCVYEPANNHGANTFGGIHPSSLPAGGGGGSDAEGFGIYFDVSSSSGGWSYGTWAVTAP
jgi:hypothetical protein